MIQARLFRVRITWSERDEDEERDVSRSAEWLFEVPQYWRVLPALLAENAVPEHNHTMEVWEIKAAGS